MEIIPYTSLDTKQDSVKTIQIQESQISIDQTQLEKIIQASIKKPEGIDLIDILEEKKIEQTLNPQKEIKSQRLKILTDEAQKEEDQKTFSWNELSLEQILSGFSKTFILLLKKGPRFFDWIPNDPEQERFIYFGIIIILIALILLL